LQIATFQKKRYRVCRTEEEISNLPPDSTDIFKRNMLDRYMDRPNLEFKNGKYSMIDKMCYSEFLSNYSQKVKTKPEDVNDSQPEILEELIEEIENETKYPKCLPLMSYKESLSLRREKCVLRYHVPSRDKNPEGYAHHLLLMFYPFRKESELLNENSGTYTEKLLEDGVLDILNRNKIICEPFGELVEEAMLNFHANVDNLDSFAEQENDDISDGIHNHDDEIHETENEQIIGNTIPVIIEPEISDEELHKKIRTLNETQRNIFEVVNQWVRKSIKGLSCNNTHNIIDPIHIFLTGSAGCGKSHLITTISQTLKKALSYRTGNLEKDKILILAPTGVAAINVGGNTIHSALGIPVDRNFSKNVPRLGDKKRSTLRNKLSELSIIVIDEISIFTIAYSPTINRNIWMFRQHSICRNIGYSMR